MISYPLPIPTSATTANMGSADKTRVAKAQTVLEISCRCVTGQTSMGATVIHRDPPGQPFPVAPGLQIEKCARANEAPVPQRRMYLKVIAESLPFYLCQGIQRVCPQRDAVAKTRYILTVNACKCCYHMSSSKVLGVFEDTFLQTI